MCLNVLEKFVGFVGKCLSLFSKLLMTVGALFFLGGISYLLDGYSRGEWLPMAISGFLTMSMGFVFQIFAKSWFFQPLTKKEDTRMFLDGKEYKSIREG
jgi:hypothetical protein